MTGELLLSASPGELWAALVRDGALEGLRVLRVGRSGRVGEVLLGRIVALKPELPAALVEIGLERPGFLSAEDALPGAGLTGLHEGQAVVVQVTKEARADKAAGLTLRLRLAGRGLTLTPGRPGVAADQRLAPEEVRRLAAEMAVIVRPDEGFLLQKSAAGADRDALAEEAEALRARWRRIEAAKGEARAPQPLEEPETPMALALAEFMAERPDAIIVDDRAAFAEARRWLERHAPKLAARLALHRGAVPLFEERGVAGDIDAALAPRIVLAGGGALAIEETAAATMIDVDMAGAGHGSGAARAIVAVNLAAAREIARQIRLRGIAGPIIVDFIGMKRRQDRDRVRAALEKALAGDAELLGWTRLGHVELVRKRRQTPLAELLFERRPGGGREKSALTVALEALRALDRAAAATPPRAPLLRVHPDVAALLDGAARKARQEVERRLGRPLALAAEPGRARDRFDIELG